MRKINTAYLVILESYESISGINWVTEQFLRILLLAAI